jgi:hypothetical protein
VFKIEIDDEIILDTDNERIIDIDEINGRTAYEN